MRANAASLIGSWSLVQLGYRASLIAMPLLALQQTGSVWAVGLVSGAGGIPLITAPWWSGPLQRRFSSAAALAGLMAAEGVATLVVPVAAAFDALTAVVMVAAGLTIGVLNAVSGPLDASLLAALGDQADDRGRSSAAGSQRSGAARLLSVQDSAVKVSMTIAPLVTLPLLPVIGPGWTVASEGILGLCAAALVATLRVSCAAAGENERPRVRMLLRRHPQVATGWAVRGVGCAAWFAFTLGLTLLGESEGRGVLLAAVGLTSYSAGAVAGSALGVVTASCRRPALVNSLTWLVAGGGWLTMGLAPDVWVIGVAGAVMGLAVPAGNAATMAMVTRSFGGLERRAALTAQTTVVTGSSTLGMLFGGPLIAAIGARSAIVLAGLVVAATAAIVAATETRRGRSRIRAANRLFAGTMSYERRDGELPRLQRG